MCTFPWDLEVYKVMLYWLLKSMIYIVGPLSKSLSFWGRWYLTWYQSSGSARSQIQILPLAFVSPFVFVHNAPFVVCALSAVWFVSPHASGGCTWGECWRAWYTSLAHYLIASAFERDRWFLSLTTLYDHFKQWPNDVSLNVLDRFWVDLHTNQCIM